MSVQAICSRLQVPQLVTDHIKEYNEYNINRAKYDKVIQQIKYAKNSQEYLYKEYSDIIEFEFLNHFKLNKKIDNWMYYWNDNDPNNELYLAISTENVNTILYYFPN